MLHALSPIRLVYNLERVAGDELMPIFEYLCSGCGKRFEALIRGSEKPHCPKCNSTRLEQQFSAFAFAAGHSNVESADTSSDSGPGCGQCGMGDGSCGFDDD